MIRSLIYWTFTCLLCLSCVSDRFKVSENQYHSDQMINANDVYINASDAYINASDVYINTNDVYINQDLSNPNKMNDMMTGFDMNPFIDMQVRIEMPMIDWIFIESGSFMMGPTKGTTANEYPEEFPLRLVTIQDSFWIGKTEVTVAQYKACVQAGVCTLPQSLQGCNWDQVDIDQHPINCVNWLQARTFAHWIGGELPSEAEWEYAGRSKGLDVIFPWGDDDPNCDRLNYDQPCFQSTTPVCALPQGNTQLGLCDMAGNVSEFMLDHYHPSYEQAPTTQAPWCDTLNCEIIEDRFVSIRGGSWGNPFYHGVRVTHRNRSMAIQPEYPNNGGFRVVKKIEF